MIQKEPYNIRRYPDTGQHIMAQTHADQIVVYQAYKQEIADYALENGVLGGPAFSFSRMSWIKPNFLWMMFRSGWAQKEGQEKVLAFWIDQPFFDDILQQAAFSSFNPAIHPDMAAWKADLVIKEARLQWDPDHDPYGQPLQRRAIQIGLKGKLLHSFATQHIRHIEDITPFVLEQYHCVRNRDLDQLMVPIERIYKPNSPSVCRQIGID